MIVPSANSCCGFLKFVSTDSVGVVDPRFRVYKRMWNCSRNQPPRRQRRLRRRKSWAPLAAHRAGCSLTSGWRSTFRKKSVLQDHYYMVVRAIADTKVTVELHEDVHPHPPLI